MPGIRQLFSELQSQQIPFGIASNSPRSYINYTLVKHGLKLAVALGIEDVRRPKPNPDAFITCAQRLGSDIDRSLTIVLEDSAHGIHAARKAGMWAIGVTCGNEQALMDAGAHTLIKRTMDLTLQPWFHNLTLLNQL